MSRIARRALLGIVATLALVVGAAAPASAAPYVGSITAGSLFVSTVSPPGGFTFDLVGAPPVAAPCPDDGIAPTITVDFDGFGGTTVTGVALKKQQVEIWPGSGSWYHVNATLGSGPSTGSISGSTFTQNLSLRLSFHQIANPATDCDVKRASRCTIQTNLVLTGSWTGGTAPPGVATLSGGPANVTRAGACNAPFASFFPASGTLAQATMTGLSVTF